MRLDRLAALFLMRAHTEGLFRNRGAIPVLMYHSVSRDPGRRKAAYYQLATSPERFRRQMQLLRDNGYQTIDLSDAWRTTESRLGGEAARPVVITFDDGFRDFLTSAWPVLEELNFSATVFLPTAFIGPRPLLFKGRECLTWPDLRALSARGVSFGSHTVSHPVLYDLPWSQIRRELRDSRQCIEDALGVPVRLFAYPYAYPQEDQKYCGRLRTELLAEGYEAAVTTVIGRLSLSRENCIKRLPINDCDDDALFLAKLAGAYDWMGTVQRHVRQLKGLASRRVPHARAISFT